MFFRQSFELIRKPSVWRLVALQSGVLLVALLLFLALAHWSVRRDLSEASRSRMQEELIELAAIYNHGGLPALNVAATAQPLDEDRRLVRLTTPQGDALLESRVDVSREYPWRTLTPFYLEPGQIDWHILPHASRDERLIVGRIGLPDGKRLWYARIDREELAAAGEMTQRLAFLGGFAALLGLLPVIWYMQHVMEPLRALIRAAHRLTLGPTSTRLHAPAAIAELREFAEAFNTSLDRIARLTSELQSVNDHLAHELRTPLARIRGNLENLLDHYGEPGGEEAAIHGMEEIDRATHLVQSILTIRLGDSGAMRLHLELTSPFMLISDLVQLYAPAAEERGLTIHYDAENDALVLLDRQRVSQAITNLLDNALSYTPPGGHITLLQTADIHGLLLRMQDTGPGLKGDDDERIWRRFARGSAATDGKQGTGIGLPLVKAVCRAHFGDAGAFNRPEGGAEFWMKLPLTPDVGEQVV